MMRTLASNWTFWAVLSAVFAALTAVLGKVGVEGVNSDFATLIRTLVILALTVAIVILTKAFQPLSAVTGRSYVFLLFSGLATGASWLCYYRALKLGPVAKVAPIDKLSVVVVALFAATFLGERLSGRSWLGVALIAAGAVLVALQG